MSANSAALRGSASESRRYRAVLFDFDGTLTPSLPLWVKSYHVALRHFGVVLGEEELLRRCMYRDWSAVAADLGISSGEVLEEQMKLALHEVFLEATLFPLTLALLMHCRAHGLQTALVTSSPRAIVAGALPRLGLQEQFDFVICGDDVTKCKPHPEPLLTAMAALGRSPGETMMVGDARVDILAGKAAGTTTALYLPADHHPFHSPAALRATEPDHIFADHAELPPLLGLPQL